MSDTQLKPHDTLSCDGQTVSWLASAWTKEDIIEEWDWLELTLDSFDEAWFACRWTTDKERADENTLYDLFGDFEDIDTSVYYWQAESNTPSAHLYWTIDS